MQALTFFKKYWLGILLVLAIALVLIVMRPFGQSDDKPSPLVNEQQISSTKSLKPSSFSMEIDIHRVILRGELSSQKEIDQLIYGAKNQYGPGSVVSYLSVADDVSSLEKLDQLVVGLDQRKLMVEVSGNQVTLSGHADSEKTKQVMTQVYKKRFGTGYKVINNMSLEKRMPPESPDEGF